METGRERYESNEWAKALAVKPDAMNRNTIIVYGLKVPGLMLHEYQRKSRSYGSTESARGYKPE